jgi:hypothetical protein
MGCMKRRWRYYMGSAGVLVAGVCLVCLSAHAQNASGQEASPVPYDTTKVAGNFDQIHILPPGGPVTRTADGHPNLTGRYYPNKAGRMIQGAYRVDQSITRQYDPAAQENPVFRPETKEKYQFPTPYGICAPGGTPTSITTQATEHGPFELVQVPGAVWILTEFPQTIRWVPTDGRPHTADPDVSFNGESVGHWEGDTLVVDTIAIDTRMRNISVGRSGDTNAWTHSEQEHIIERFSRPSKNYLTYQVTVVDPVVLTKPFTSAPQAWTLAQDPNDNWTEYLCTANEEPFHWENMDPEHRESYNKGLDRAGDANGGVN